MEDLKNKIEAVLFSSGKKMGVEDISKLCRADQAEVTKLLHKLKEEYQTKSSSLLLVEESDGWKLTVHEQYAPVVRKIVTETELTRSVMETLAVIAWKAPVLQSEIVKVRTNKAYEHLAELETSGYISRQRHGRTRLLKLTDRFFNYFDLKNAEQVKEKFKIEEPSPEDPVATNSSENSPSNNQDQSKKPSTDIHPQ